MSKLYLYPFNIIIHFVAGVMNIDRTAPAVITLATIALRLDSSAHASAAAYFTYSALPIADIRIIEAFRAT